MISLFHFRQQDDMGSEYQMTWWLYQHSQSFGFSSVEERKNTLMIVAMEYFANI